MGRSENQIREFPLDKLGGTLIKSSGIRLGANLNSGGWGTVYLGRQNAPARPATSSANCSPNTARSLKRFMKSTFSRQPAKLYAVKVLQTARKGDDKQMQDDEERIHLRASSYNHPNIVKLHQVVKESEMTFFVLVSCSLCNWGFRADISLRTTAQAVIYSVPSCTRGSMATFPL